MRKRKKPKPMPAKKTSKRKKSTKLKLASNSRYSLKRMLPFLLVFAVVGSVMLFRSFAAPGGGGKTGGGTSFVWKQYDVTINAPVEQWVNWPFPAREMWVVNSAASVSPPGPCAWDVDDDWYLLAQGTINAGSTINADHCRVADPEKMWRTVNGKTAWWGQNPRHMGVRVQSPSPNLVVSIAYTPQARTFTLTPTYDSQSREYIYRGCVALQYRPNDPNWPYERDEAVQPIPGSNGGWGVITHAKVSVTNPTGRKVSATGKLEELAAWKSDATLASFCSANKSVYEDWQHEYPFKYRLN